MADLSQTVAEQGAESDSLVIFAAGGIGEVAAGEDLATLIASAVAAHPYGPLRPGDIVVVTSKIVSKQEGRRRPTAELAAALAAETRRTVTRRGPMAVVESRLGVVQAAAGVDRSNVAADQILLLPLDPDASATRLCCSLSAHAGGPVGVVLSDTAGRAWRLGQIDHALGAAGVRVLVGYEGRHDPYGNELRVTNVALADELAAAGDLVKRKLAQRPVAVVRGLAGLVVPLPPADRPDKTERAANLLRPAASDLFHHGTREAVLAALAAALGVPERLERLITLDDPADIVAELTSGTAPDPVELALLRRTVTAACRPPTPPSSD